MREPRIFVAAKISLQNAAVLRAIENRAPRFQFAHAIGRFLGVQLGHAPVVDVLAAAHRVGEMDFPIVAIVHIRQRRRDAAFGHDGVRFAEKRFANQPDRNARRRRFDRRAQSRAAGADDEHVVFESLVVGHDAINLRQSASEQFSSRARRPSSKAARKDRRNRPRTN